MPMTTEEHKIESMVENYYKQMYMNAAYACWSAAMVKSKNEDMARQWIDMAIDVLFCLGRQGNPVWSSKANFSAAQLLRFSGKYPQALVCLQQAIDTMPHWDFTQMDKKALIHQMHSQNNNKRKHSLVVHVGYPKAGSTSLQARFFPYLAEVHHLGETFYDMLTTTHDRGAMHYGFPSFRASPACTLGDEEYDGEVFAEALLKHMKPGINSLSQEDFVMHPDRLGKRLAELQDLLSIDVKVIVIGRKQSDIILSEYAQRFKNPKWDNKRINEVVSWDDVDDEGIISIPKYDYVSSIETFYDHIGRENVFFWPFELGFEDDFINDVCGFMGIEQDKSIIRHMLQRPQLNITGNRIKKEIAKLHPNMDEFVKELDDYFKTSNKYLDDLFHGYCLRDLGYYK